MELASCVHRVNAATGICHIVLPYDFTIMCHAFLGRYRFESSLLPFLSDHSILYR